MNNRIFIVVLICSLTIFVIPAVILTPFSVGYIKRYNDYRGSYMFYRDIKMIQKYQSEKICGTCKEVWTDILPDCGDLIAQNQVLSVENCFNGTGPCPDPKIECQNNGGHCCDLKDRSCERPVNNNLCYVSTNQVYVAQIKLSYYNPEFDYDFSFDDQIVFNNQKQYNIFKDAKLGSYYQIYFRVGDPYDLIGQRDFTANEKVLMGFCLAFWVIAIYCGISILIVLLIKVRN